MIIYSTNYQRLLSKNKRRKKIGKIITGVGLVEGWKVGDWLGQFEGSRDGLEKLGACVGAVEGMTVGDCVGQFDGSTDGFEKLGGRLGSHKKTRI